MSEASIRSYPRPDFERSDLHWYPLDGKWDFLFDDADCGVSQGWCQSGLPALAGLNAGSAKENQDDSVAPSTGEHLVPQLHQKSLINVPFVFQASASGVDDRGAHEVLWYERHFPDLRTEDQFQRADRLLLRFGAVDYEATVWVNGIHVGGHRGGHVPFEIDLSDSVLPSSQDNRLTVRVRDSPYDLTQPRGKQYWKPQPENIFYTPSSGIWQSVWLESVPVTRIADSSYGRRAQEQLTVEISARLGNVDVGNIRHNLPEESNVAVLDLPMWLSQSQYDRIQTTQSSATNESAWKFINNQYLALWSPESPSLYDISIKLLRPSGDLLDEVHTTTGMRSLSWTSPDNTFRLNNKPYFQALVLDQGYWPQTNMTPPTSDALKADIEISKAMGFNGCRKHQKVEDPRFLYWADRLGYLVWGEMANAYEFSSTYVDRFDAEWKEVVKRDINHSCIVTWTPGNESWGYTDLRANKSQRDHLRSLYHATKALDPTRPINDNCGWEHVCTDLTTFHEYADAPALKVVCATMDGILGEKAGRPLFVQSTDDDMGSKHSANAPIMCTEFGGVNIAPAEGVEAGDRDWGYTTASNPEDLLRRVEALVMAVVDGGLCCGLVYTQLTDIEQEVNGLYSFDRKPKLEPGKVKAIMDKARARYYELLDTPK